MANEEHLAILKKGKRRWNAWRIKNPRPLVPDLSEAELPGMDLSEYNLDKVNLLWTNLSGAKFRYADASESDLSCANLTEAKLHYAIMYEVNFSHADLTGSDLQEAKLVHSYFHHSCLKDCKLNWTLLSAAYIHNADLTKADLQEANLVDAILDGSNLTGAKLWGTIREGWSIEDVICPYAYWDREGKKRTKYNKGEFERVHAELPRVILKLPGGAETIDLLILPLIIERLGKQYPNNTLRVQSVKEDAGGASVAITVVGEATKAELSEIQARLKYIEGQRDVLRDFFLPKFFELASMVNQVNIGTASIKRIGPSMKGDSYKNYGQAASFGKGAKSENITLNQTMIDAGQLSKELRRLVSAIGRTKSEGVDMGEINEIGAVVEAAKAAKRGDSEGALKHLKSAGTWTLGIAKKIGVPVVVEYLKRSMAG